MSCEVGLRTRTYYILSGSVLSVWTKVEEVLSSVPGGHATRMQIIRLRTDEGERIVGKWFYDQDFTLDQAALHYSSDNKNVINILISHVEDNFDYFDFVLIEIFVIGKVQ